MASVRNVSYRIEDGRLVIEIPLDGDLGDSKSGMSRLVASAVGLAVKDGGGLRFNVLAYRVHPKATRRELADQALARSEEAGGA